MSYYLALKLLTPDSGTLVYERDLRLSVLETVVAGLVAQFKERDVFRPGESVWAVLSPHSDGQPAPQSVFGSAEVEEIWGDATPIGAGWLGVRVDESNQLGQPLAFFTLQLVSAPSHGETCRTITMDIPLSVFDPWLHSAQSLLVSMGVLETEQALQRQVALCESEVFTEREMFPALDEELQRMGGELEDYDVRDLKRKRMLHPKRECHSLAIPEEDALTVFIQQRVLKQLEQAARANLDREIGGLLVGQAYQDTGSDRLFITINAHIPARFALSDEITLRFSHEDSREFTRAMETTYKRRRTLGWYHTHLGDPFLSKPDRTFHRNSWQAPWHVALVLGYAGEAKLFFHWKDDQMVPLSTFYLY